MEQPSLPSQKRRTLRRKSCSSCDGVAPELHVLACARFRLQLIRLAPPGLLRVACNRADCGPIYICVEASLSRYTSTAVFYYYILNITAGCLMSCLISTVKLYLCRAVRTKIRYATGTVYGSRHTSLIAVQHAPLMPFPLYIVSSWLPHGNISPSHQIASDRIAPLHGADRISNTLQIRNLDIVLAIVFAK